VTTGKQSIIAAVPSDQDTEDGLERLRAVVRANPRSTTFVALAHALCEAGHAGEAEEVCRHGLVQHPRLVTGQVALGRALIERGRLKEAQEVLIDAAKSSPEHGDAFRWLGDLVLKAGNGTRARTILEYAEELLPTDGRVAELLMAAGGKPTVRVPRPKTDFEHTRVGNARALAERMHEDPPAPEAPRATDLPVPVVPHDATEEPTTISSTAAVQAWFASGVATPPPVSLTNGLPVPTSARASGPLPAVGPLMLGGGGGAAPARAPVERLPGSARRSGARLSLKAMVEAATRTRRTRIAALAGAGALVLVGIIVVVSAGGGGRDPLGEVEKGLGAGTLERLQAARAIGKTLLQRKPVDGDQAAIVALVNALLAADYGMPTAAEVDEAATLAEKVTPPRSSRLAVAAAARAVAALGAGKLGEGRQHAQRAVEADPELVWARLASARGQLAMGNREGARADLEKAGAAASELAPLVMEWATVALDAGTPGTAISALEALLKKHDDHLAARLLLLDAQRGAGVKADAGKAHEQCRRDGRETPGLRALCALEAGVAARLGGERAGAVRAARAAISDAGYDPRTIADAATLLALLGENDAAAKALERVRAETGPGFVPRAWAEVAVALGRGAPVAAGPAVARPASPEQRLLAARMAFAQGGASGLSAALKAMGAGLAASDPELKAFAALSNEGKMGPELAELEARADKGDPMAAYVVGRNALRAGEPRVAAQRLQRALAGHGDTCEAARLFLAVDKSFRPAAGNAGLRSLKSRNGSCAYLSP
jgi:tetratricopeptide (TPR) repeat protein